MIFRSLEYIDDPQTGKLAGVVGVIEPIMIPRVFVKNAASVDAYGWTIMIGDKVFRDIEDDYDGHYMSLYFDTDIIISDDIEMVIQLSMVRDDRNTICIIQENCKRGNGYTLEIENTDDMYLHHLLFHF